MSRNRLAGTCLVLGFLCSGVVPLAAQGRPGPTLEDLGMRIEALRPLVDDAARRGEVEEQAYLDSVRAVRQIPQDSVRVGPFQVVAVAGQGSLARDLFEPHVAKIAPFMRGSDDRFDGRVWKFFYGWKEEPIFVDADRVYRIFVRPLDSSERVDSIIEASLAGALYEALPEDAAGLRRWVTPESLFPTSDLSPVYRALAFNGSPARARCLGGELHWCWEVMGLADVMKGGSYWDSPVQRRRLVESRFGRRYRRPWERNRFGVRDALVRGCVQLEEDRACILLLEGYHLQPGRFRPAYSGTLANRWRGTLVAEALRIGGGGSFERLVSRPEDSIRDRIAFAAGVPAETVMVEWLDRVRQSRPNAQADLFRSLPTTLLWVLLMMLFAVRSVRWRLG